MELDITRFFHEAAPMDYSASIAEIGRNAGPDTWRAACDDAPDYNILDDEEKREAFRAYVGDFGAWTDEEIAAWSDVELNALLLQMIAGDIREADLDQESPDWAKYEEGAEQGRYAGNIFGGPLCVEGSQDKIFYYIGS